MTNRVLNSALTDLICVRLGTIYTPEYTRLVVVSRLVFCDIQLKLLVIREMDNGVRCFHTGYVCCEPLLNRRYVVRIQLVGWKALWKPRYDTIWMMLSVLAPQSIIQMSDLT
jgi:hypothetical protein